MQRVLLQLQRLRCLSLACSMLANKTTCDVFLAVRRLQHHHLGDASAISLLQRRHRPLAFAAAFPKSRHILLQRQTLPKVLRV